MRKLIYGMGVSIDGYIAGRGDDLSWSTPDPVLHAHYNAADAAADLVLYGRGLYELMSAYWPTAGNDPSVSAEELEYQRIWLAKPKVVFSSTLTSVDWNARLVRGDAAEEVRRLKAEAGGFMSVSGAGLAGALMQAGLIDEYHLYIFPVILGGGKRMFPALSAPQALRQTEMRSFPGGVTLLRWERAL